MSDSEKEAAGFLSRWSRRKLAPEVPVEAALDIPAEPGEVRGDDKPLAKPPAACPIPGGPEIDLASLPKVEDLTLASDLAPFLRAGVPSALRNAALRRMWSLDPSIRDFINAVDYQWDFNTPGGLPHGFSNELLGDVSKLLSQAVGDHFRVQPELELAEPELAEPKLAKAGENAEPGSEPAGEPIAVESQPIVLAAAESSPLRLSAPEPVPILAEAPAEPGLPRRRHGSALPA